MNVSPRFHARAAVLAACLIAPAWPAAAEGASAQASTAPMAPSGVSAQADRCRTEPSGAAMTSPSQRDLLLAGMALMVGIALRRASA